APPNRFQCQYRLFQRGQLDSIGAVRSQGVLVLSRPLATKVDDFAHVSRDSPPGASRWLAGLRSALEIQLPISSASPGLGGSAVYKFVFRISRSGNESHPIVVHWSHRASLGRSAGFSCLSQSAEEYGA